MNASRVGALLGAVAMALLAVHAVRVGGAGIDGRVAQDALVRLDAGQVLAPAAVDAARRAAEAARRADPRAGAPDEWLARFELHAAAASNDPATRRAHRDAARRHAAAAQAARPAWPYAAAIVATAEATDQRHGERFQAAVASAWRNGRHERRIRDTLARLWLRPAARGAAPQLAEAFDAALEREPGRWIDAADRAGSAPEACARAGAPPAARALRGTGLGAVARDCGRCARLESAVHRYRSTRCRTTSKAASLNWRSGSPSRTTCWARSIARSRSRIACSATCTRKSLACAPAWRPCAPRWGTMSGLNPRHRTTDHG